MMKTPVHDDEIVARFREKFEKRGEHHCWPWRAGKSKNGYGAFKCRTGSCRGAHQVAWEIANGERLDGRLACHICDNKLCCNPAHIYAGDRKQNMLDAMDRGKIVRLDQRGENNGNAKLTTQDVMIVYERIKRGETNIAIAIDYPVTHQMISKIRRGHFWK